MKIAQLKAALSEENASEIKAVYFEPPVELSTNTEKEYPIILWDENSVKFNTNLRAAGGVPETAYNMNGFIIGFHDEGSKENTEDRYDKWQELQEQLKDYIQAINAKDNRLTIVDEEIEGEFYTKGAISVDYEIAIGFKIEIITWCQE